MIEEDLHAGFLDEIVEHRFGHVRLEVPLDGPAVLLADAFEELERVTANHFFLAVVGPAEAAGHHAAQMFSWFEECHVQPLASGSDRCRNAAGCAAVNHEVELLRRWWRR